jgi:hypothetical protein
MKYVACIGSRALNLEEQDLCFKIGKFLSKDYIIKTGNAKGADQAYARGVNLIDPKRLYLYLPWKTYNLEALVNGNAILYEPEKEWFNIAKETHLFWDSLGYGGKALHARNVGIVENVEFVIAFPNNSNGGGTVMGMRLATKNNIPVYNLREENEKIRWQYLVE